LVRAVSFPLLGFERGIDLLHALQRWTLLRVVLRADFLGSLERHVLEHVR
jgi:hypothetical protein